MILFKSAKLFMPHDLWDLVTHFIGLLLWQKAYCLHFWSSAKYKGWRVQGWGVMTSPTWSLTRCNDALLEGDLAMFACGICLSSAPGGTTE